MSFDNWKEVNGLTDMFENPSSDFIQSATRCKTIAENMLSKGDLDGALWAMRDACDFALMAIKQEREAQR